MLNVNSISDYHMGQMNSKYTILVKMHNFKLITTHLFPEEK